MPRYRVFVRDENWGWLDVTAETAEEAERDAREALVAENGYGFWRHCRLFDGEVQVEAEEVPA